MLFRNKNPVSKMCSVVTVALLIWLSIDINRVVHCAREPPMVNIPDQGMVQGTFLKMFRTQVIVAYLGLPFAQPPIDERRFQPPVTDTLPRWDNVRNASTLQPECFQNSLKPKRRHEDAFMSLILKTHVENGAVNGKDDDEARQYDEDCLFLNIYIPDGPTPTDGYAVVAWLHGGDFSYGSPTELDPFQLVLKQKIIVVSISYRLNIFGFFTSADGESAGNYGLMDQSVAMFWIKKNIKLFGGNDGAITVMGHGSGAVSAGLHLTSGEWSEDMFHRVIIMSGSAFLDSEVRDPKSYNSAIDQTASAFGCYRRPTSMLLECLRNVPAQVMSEKSPVLDWGPVMDNGLSNTTTPFIRDFPRLLAERGMIRNVPVMLGHTDMEDILDFVDDMQAGMTSEMYDSILTDMVVSEIAQYETNDTCGNTQIISDAVNFVYRPYPPTNNQDILRQKLVEYTTERNYAAPTILLANYISKMSDTYMYRFDMKARTMAVLKGFPDWIGVPHKFDMLFIWGLPYWAALPNNTQWDAQDKRVSDIIMTLWANFVKSGNPTQSGVYIKWDKFTADNPGILIIDRAFNMSDRSSMNYGAYQFWNDYYPRVVSFAAQCCNATDSGGIRLLPRSPTTLRLMILVQLLVLVLSAISSKC